VTGSGTAAGQDPAPDSAVLITHAETVMGTVVSFTVVTGDVPEPMARAAIRSACAVLHAADATFSTWKPGSPLSRLRRGEITLRQAPTEIPEVLGLCEAARDASHGWFDPWALPGGADPTGLVKGWAVERALAVLRRAGLPAALVNGGGDVACYGMPAPGRRWRVGIQHPWRRDALACVIDVESAVATSGTYERGPHLIDPGTGRPGARAVSATVTGPGLALADALATAVAVGGDEALAAVAGLEGYEGYLIRPDGSETDIGGMAFVHTEPGSARDPLG
jgi:thiamine biosynthesis lipoprotein